MGNGVLKFKSTFLRSTFKKLQTDTQNEDLDEELEKKQNQYMKVRSKKFSVVGEDSSLSPVNRRRTILNKASSSEDSSLSSIAESLEEKIDTLTRLKSINSKNNIKNIKESSSELDEKDKMSEFLDHEEENKLNEFDSYIDLEMRHSRQHIFEVKDQFSKSEHDDKNNQDELHNFYKYIKPNTNLFKKKIFISSEQPEYEKEEPNDEKKYKIEIIDYTKTTYKVGDNEDSIQSAGKKSPAKYIRSANSEEKEDLIELGINVICRKGSIQDYPNQDDYFIFIDQHTRIFSVFDGHGPFGHVISRLTYKIIMKNLIEHPNFFNDPNLALKNIFINLKEKIKKYLKINLTKQTIKDKPPNMKFSGVTTSIVMQRDRFLYIAHLGDSRVIIGKKQKSKKFPYQLTTDHVPTLPSEKKRIYTNGGEVRKLNNDYIEKIFVRGRIYPGLAVSRSIGDEVASYIGVIGEPEINVYEINPNIDQFILVGTKSVFNYLEEYEIMSILSSFTGKSVKIASDYLYKRVKSAWIQNENGYDDITLIVSYF